MSQAGPIDIIGTNPEIPTEFITDDGNAIPIANQLEILGQLAFSSPAMFTLGSGNTVSIENRTWSTPYVVDANATVGERGTFTTIQDAIDACVADGNASQLGYIYVRKGFYTENLSFPSSGNFFIQGPSPNNSLGINNNVVNIIGIHTLGDSATLIAQNIRFSNGFSVAFNFTGSPIFASFYSCQVSVNLASASMLLTFNDCTSDNASMTFSNGSVYAFNSGLGNLTLSGGGQIFYRCQVGSAVLSNAVDPVCRYCIFGNNATWTGTTSGTPEFYDCITEATFNYTGNIRVGGLSEGLLTTGDFFGSNITEKLTRSTQGSVLIRRTVATSSTVANTDYYIGVTSTAAARTITLPDTSSTNLRPYKGQCFKVKDESGAAGTNAITVTPNGGNIDGAANYPINTNYGFVEVMFDGTNYFVVS